MTPLSRRSVLSGLAASTLAAPTPVRAQNWPEPGRIISLIVPFPAGGGTDVVARVLADRLSAETRARFVVENRPGGGGSIGYLAAARAAPDGGTVLLTSSSIATMPHLYPTKGYEPLRELTPACLIGSAPSLLCVGPSVKAPNLAAFLEDAKARPGQLTYASAGVGSALHLSMELFRKMAGIEIKHVPYKGAALATGDLLGGRVDMILDIISSVKPLVGDGQLRALGISTAKRSPLAPEIPPMADAVPGYDFAAWFALFLPAGAPPDMAERLQAATAAALAGPDLKARYDVLGVEIAGGKPAELRHLLTSDLERWGRLIRKLGITAEG